MSTTRSGEAAFALSRNGTLQGGNHSHLILTGNVTFDLVGPLRNLLRSVTPFVVVGAGPFRSRSTFADEVFTSTEGVFTAGGGIRARAGKRVTIGAEARIGWELHLRLNGFLSVRLGRP